MIVPPLEALLLEPRGSAAGAAIGAPPAPVPAEPAPSRPGGGRALETALAAVWADVLGYDSVAPDADFYELGGDSIAGARIVEQIVRDLGHPTTLADLFQSGTVAALAERLRGRAGERNPASRGLLPAPARDRYPVAWEQLAVLRAEEAADMGAAYNLPSGLELPENIDIGRLRTAVDALIGRHEILRTRFIRPADGGEPAMEILPPAPAVIEEIELSGDAGLGEALKGWVRPFDLWSGVPMRLVLACVGGKPRALLLDVHHSLADAFTMELLLGNWPAYTPGPRGPRRPSI